MKVIITLFFLSSSFLLSAQSQLAMSFTGNYNIGLQDLQDNFDNGLGLTAELYYFFDDSPFAISLSVSTNAFYANEEYKQAYTAAQQNILDKFKYEITQYSIPILIAGNYHFFRNKKFQIGVGLSAGLYSLTHKFKQTSEHFSDTRLDTKNEFGAYPHASLMYEISDSIGLLLKGGYNQTFGTQSLSYTDIRLGLIYKI